VSVAETSNDYCVVVQEVDVRDVCCVCLLRRCSNYSQYIILVRGQLNIHTWVVCLRLKDIFLVVIITPHRIHAMRTNAIDNSGVSVCHAGGMFKNGSTSYLEWRLLGTHYTVC